MNEVKESRYEDLGEEFLEVPLGKHKMDIACCDCGLVHTIYYDTTGGMLRMFFERYDRATGQLRRYLHGNLQNEGVGKWKMIRK